MAFNRAIIASIFPGLFYIIGMIIGSKWSMTSTTQEAVEQLIAGIFFATISIEIIPLIEVVKDFKHKIAVILGLLLGASVMIGISYKLDDSSNMFPMSIRNIIDGFTAGMVAHQVKGIRGYIVSMWFSIDNLILGIHMGNKLNTKQKIIYGLLTPSLLLIGSIIGWYLLSRLKNTPLEYSIFAFGISAILWIITTELIPSTPIKNIIYPIMMYIGFLLVVMTAWFT